MRARWLENVWPGLAITLLACLVRLLTPGVSPDAGAVLVSFAYMALVVAAIASLGIWMAPQHQATMGRLTVGLGTFVGSWAMLTSLSSRELIGADFSLWLLLSVGLTLAALAAHAIGNDTLRSWQHARLVNRQLQISLDQESGLNALLLSAQQDRFENYAQVLQVQVQEPLNRIHDQHTDLTDAELADALNAFLSNVMRPLAHLLHPVSVRAGLIPALLALGPTFIVRAEPDIVDEDARGVLLDEHVRHQAYRWLRHLEPAESHLEIEFARDGATLVIAPSAAASRRPLDTIQRVAGLHLGPEGELRAPMRGTPATIVIDAEEQFTRVGQPSRRRFPSISSSPVVSVGLTAIVALVTLPAQAYIVGFSIGVPQAIAVSLSALLPVLTAALLQLAPVPVAKVKAAWWTVACWCAIGLVSAGASIATLLLFSDVGFTAVTASSILLRSLMRYSVGGLTFQLARGYAAQAESDTNQLRVSLEAQHTERIRLLEEADFTDRMISESLHRSVQGRLSAVVLLLRLQRRAEAVTEFEGVRTITLPILLNRLMHPGLSGDSLSARTPARLLGIELDDHVDWSEVDRRWPTLSTDLKRVIDECLVNAQRHGAATHMTVSATFDSDYLTLVCVDDGTKAESSQRAGLGSHIFDEVSLRHDGTWELTRSASGAEFSLTVATN